MRIKFLKKASTILVALLAITANGVSAQTASDITDLILVTGQSNAQGSLTDYDPTIDTVHPRVLAFTSDGTWQQADLHQAWDVNDWHPGNGSLADPTRTPYNNFAFHFAKSVAEADPTRVVGIVVASAPGEGIQHWDINGSFYNEVENKALTALNAIPGKSSFDGILWHQGETDALFFGTSDPDPQVTNDERNHDTYYPEKLSSLITNFRSSTWFGSGKPFICGETKKAITTAGEPSVNGRLMELNTDGNPWTGCVVANDLSTRDADPDTGNVGTHFDANGLRVLGHRYANEYLQMTDVSPKDGSVKIMAVGDSITQGVAGQVSYRVELDSLLDLSGCSYEWVGGRGTSPLLHEGYSGQSADQFFTAADPTQGRINTLMTTYNPDVVLLHLGSNDMRKSQTVANTIDEINEIINRIKNPNNISNDTTYTDTTILIANVIPWWGSAFENGVENTNITSDIDQLGTAIENLVESRSDLSISLVDVRTGFTPPMMVSDLIHPNKAGEAFIADAFIHTYGTYYDCAQSPDLTAPRTFITVPAENESLVGTVTYSGYATDTGGSGINRVRVAVRDTTTQDWYSFSDGTFGPISNNGIKDLTPPVASTPTANFDWDISLTLPTGSYQFFALAEDNNGNDAFTGKGLPLWPVRANFSVVGLQDTTNPSITIATPTIGNSSVTISGTANDNVAVDRIRLLIKNTTTDEFWNGTAWTNTWSWFAPNGTNNWSYDLNLPVGNFSTIAWAWDTSDNRTKSTTETFTVGSNDTTPPSVTIDTLTPEQLIPGLVTISGDANDNVAIDRVRLLIRNKDTAQYWNGAAWTNTWSWFAPAGTSDWSYQLTLPAASYSSIAWAWDLSNNRMNSTTYSFSVGDIDTTPDSTLPTVQILDPTSQSFVSTGAVTISITSNDNIAIDRNRLLIRNMQTGQYWTGQQWVATWSWFTPDSGSLQSANTTLPIIDEGLYRIVAWTWDTSNNQSLTDAQTIDVQSSSSPAPQAEFITQLQSLSTGKCIEITNQATSPNANADTNSCINNAAHQRLHFIPIAIASNTYSIEFEHSGLCLTVPNSSDTNGASLIQQNCSDGDLSQQFTLADDNGDKSRIAVFTNTTTGKVIDSHAETDDLIQWTDFGNNNQRWAVYNIEYTNN